MAKGVGIVLSVPTWFGGFLVPSFLYVKGVASTEAQKGGAFLFYCVVTHMHVWFIYISRAFSASYIVWL